jgi:hypothetical protein
MHQKTELGTVQGRLGAGGLLMHAKELACAHGPRSWRGSLWSPSG